MLNLILHKIVSLNTGRMPFVLIISQFTVTLTMSFVHVHRRLTVFFKLCGISTFSMDCLNWVHFFFRFCSQKSSKLVPGITLELIEK